MGRHSPTEVLIWKKLVTTKKVDIIGRKPFLLFKGRYENGSYIWGLDRSGRVSQGWPDRSADRLVPRHVAERQRRDVPGRSDQPGTRQAEHQGRAAQGYPPGRAPVLAGDARVLLAAHDRAQGSR